MAGTHAGPHDPGTPVVGLGAENTLDERMDADINLALIEVDEWTIDDGGVGTEEQLTFTRGAYTFSLWDYEDGTFSLSAGSANIYLGNMDKVLIDDAVDGLGADELIYVNDGGALETYFLQVVDTGAAPALADLALPTKNDTTRLGLVLNVGGRLYRISSYTGGKGGSYAGKNLLDTSNVFVSTEQTGNGGAQNVAHGLGAVPSKVFVSVTDLPDAAAETGFSIVEGAHDATNVVVTVTNTVKYKVMAWYLPTISG